MPNKKLKTPKKLHLNESIKGVRKLKSLFSHSAFSLVEILVIVSIIAILSVIGMTVYREVRLTTLTVKLASDLRDIEIAFKSMYTVKGLVSLPGDSIYPHPTGETECGTWNQNPVISKTDLLDSTLLGGAPPYLSGPPINPITNREYRYDYDPEDIDGSINDGVNLRLYFCTPEERSEAKRFLDKLDGMIDNKDGPNKGKVRWYVNADGTPDSLIYNMDAPHTPL